MGKRKPRKFNDQHLRSVCAAVRTYYLMHRKMPELDALDAICDVPREKITAVLVHDDFMSAMEDTGIPVRDRKGLSITQHHALVMMTDPNDKRPFHVRLKEAGITPVTWKAWLRHPVFASFLEQFYENALGDHMNAAHLSLMNQVDKGNVPALTLYYSMTGRYDPRSQQERDFQGVLSTLMEILQRKLDPNLLAEIAQELQDLQGGRKPKAAITPAVADTVDVEEIPIENNRIRADTEYSPNWFKESRKTKYESEGWTVGDKEAFLESGGAKPAPAFDTSLFD